MATDELISIEVAYARPEAQVILALRVKPGCTILEAIRLSGILQQFPEIDLEQQPVGIFSQPKRLHDTLREADRIEIYRPLLVDPKEGRRRKAKNPKRGS